MFLMYRVELKEEFCCLFRRVVVKFLMYRVELKDFGATTKTLSKPLFLMYRVELKASYLPQSK